MRVDLYSTFNAAISLWKKNNKISAKLPNNQAPLRCADILTSQRVKHERFSRHVGKAKGWKGRRVKGLWLEHFHSKAKSYVLPRVQHFANCIYDSSCTSHL